MGLWLLDVTDRPSLHTPVIMRRLARSSVFQRGMFSGRPSIMGMVRLRRQQLHNPSLMLSTLALTTPLQARCAAQLLHSR